MENLIRQQIEEINATISRTNELYGRWAKKHGLNYNSLMILYTMHGKESCTQKQICDEWLIPKQTVNTILKEFKEKGYVLLETDLLDKREKIVRFTECGREYADKFLSELHEMEERAMKNMGADMCKMLVESNQMFCELFEAEVENE